MSNDGKRVAIVGGGYSGTILAARLAEHGVASSLIERTGTFGSGLAYATASDDSGTSAACCIQRASLIPQ